MRAAIVPLLCCPVTGQPLRLHVERAEVTTCPNGVNLDAYDEAELETVVEQADIGGRLPPSDEPLATRLMRYEVIEGALYTEDRTHVYPIVGRVPRLLPPDVCQHPEQVEYYSRKLEADASASEEMPAHWKSILDHNIESYTLQWDEFGYEESTWGFSIEQRFKMIRDELGIRDPVEMGGKRHVDAACGNGTLALRTAEMGLEVFAFDQSHSIERAEAFARAEDLPKLGIVHFIHGNLVAPPLRKGAFDSLYSGGAIHMTPDFAHTLRELVALMKPSDARIYVWTGRRRVVLGVLYDAVRWFLKLFPLPARRVVARIGVVPYMGAWWVMRRIYGAKAFPPVTFNESLVLMLDAASHRFGQVPREAAFEAMFREHPFDSYELKRPGHRGYGILARR